jgi:hypothetical protein
VFKNLSMIFVVLAPLLNLRAFAETQTAPISGIYSAPCSSEAIAISGTLVSEIHQQFNNNAGQVQFHTKEGAGTTGIGITSGSPYAVNINQFASFWFDANVMESISMKQKMTLKGAGPDNDLSITYFVKGSFDPETNQFVTKFERLAIDCK